MSRVEATRRVTCQAAAWLWARKCRVLALEAGLSWSGEITTPWKGHWRVDLAAVSVKDRHCRSYVVEVKGTKPDLSRELVTKRSKWHQRLTHEAWVACGDLATGRLAAERIPGHWGVIVFDGDGDIRVVRKPPPAPETLVTDAAKMLLALAAIQTAGSLPTFFNSRGAASRPWQRLMADGWAEDLVWTRDNNDEQMELFYETDTTDSTQQKRKPRQVHGNGD